MSKNLIEITDTYGELRLIPITYIMELNITTKQILVLNYNVPIRCNAGQEWDNLVAKFREYYGG